MSAPTLIDAIDYAMDRVKPQVAAALNAGDHAEAGRIIHAEAQRQLADWVELERPDTVSDDDLAQAFRDVYAAEEMRARYREKQREQWAEMTAEVRAHEAGE